MDPGNPKPKKVFHYTSLEGALGILSGGVLRLSPLAETNDPYEWTNFHPSGTFRYCPEDEERAMQQMDDLMREWGMLRQRYQLFCTHSGVGLDSLPEPSSRDGRANLAMWAYHGRNHTGVCLVFDRQVLAMELNEGAERVLEGPVLYQPHDRQKWTEAHSLLNKSDLAGNPNNVTREHVIDHQNQLFFRKSPEWAVENEWRWVIDSWVNGRVEIPIKSSLVEVSLGLKAHSHRPCVESSIQNGAKLSQVHWEPHKACLEIDYCT